MAGRWQLKNLSNLNKAAHRDFGYFFSTLIVVYCLSGIALNHSEWNADFIVDKKDVGLNHQFKASQITAKEIAELDKLVGEESHKMYDFPTPSQVKIYYDNASFHVNFTTDSGHYERLRRRPVFHQVNVLHRNSLKQWRWFSDIFAVGLIVVNLTGIFVLKGSQGISGRGKWLILLGFLPPVIAWAVFYWGR